MMVYRGRLHSHTPFIGRKVLTKHEKEWVAWGVGVG